MKIGIFAGTFDPVHNGHVEFARKAVRETELDRVVMVAEKDPYRKKPFASWDHRQAMIERATKGILEADHDYAFANQLAHQFTMQNMLQVARKHFGDEHEIWFLVGSDIFKHISRWQDVIRQNEYGGFVVALRDDHTKEWLDERVSYVQQNHFPIYVQVISSHHPHISSRKIRDQVADGGVVDNTDDAVKQYILDHSLYQVG